MLQALSDVLNTLGGAEPAAFRARKKIDGSPSCIAASNFHGDRFVATKGFFAKDRKIARTPDDVKKYFGHAPDLARKMLKLLSHLDEINIPTNEIWQGDFLFDSETVFEADLGGELCVAFHPNTIVYAIPLKDPLARKVKRADIGVAWHTRYVGADVDALHISFDVSLNEIQQTPTVFQIDGSIGNPDKSSAFDQDKFLELQKLLSEIRSDVHKLQEKHVLETIATDSNMQTYFLSFRNYLIKAFNTQHSSDYSKQMLSWVKDKFDKEIAKKKMQKTKDALEATKEAELDKLRQLGSSALYDIGDAQKQIVELKEELIRKLESLAGWKTFLKYVDAGYLPTGEEGYAISDTEGNIQKFVSRLEFSKANFSKDVVKGWMSDSRIMEKTIDIPDTLPPKLADLLGVLGDAAGTLSKRQINQLASTVHTVLGNDGKKDELKLLSKAAGSLSQKLLPAITEAFSSVDRESLTKLNNALLVDPIIPEEMFKSFVGKPVVWKDLIYDKISQHYDDAEDAEIVTEALANLFWVEASGFGRGELLLAILTQGKKGVVGDVSAPFGELEIKSDGRVISARVSRGDSGAAEQAIYDIVSHYPEIQQLPEALWDITKKKHIAGPYTPRVKNLKTTYTAINEVLDPEKRKQFWSEVYTTYVDIFHVYAKRLGVVDETLVESISTLLAENKLEEAVIMLGALQFDIYKKCDGFDYLVFIGQKYMLIAQSTSDIINNATLAKKSSKKLLLKPPVIGPDGQQGNMSCFIVE